MFRLVLGIPMLLLGFLGAVYLYRINNEESAGAGAFRFDWETSTEFAPLVAVGIACASSLLLIFWLAHFVKNYKQVKSNTSMVLLLPAISLIWIGFGGGMLAPALLAGGLSSSIGDPSKLTSVHYKLELEKFRLPPDVRKFSGPERPGPFLEVGENGQVLVFSNSPGLVNLNDQPQLRSGSVGFLTLDLQSENFSPMQVLTEKIPEIQHVRDVLLTDMGLVITNVFNNNNECFAFQVWVLQLSAGQNQIVDGEKLWEADPCLTAGMSPSGSVGLHQSGGRLVELPNRSLLVSVGDFGLGLSSAGDYVSRPKPLLADGWFGKSVLIDSNNSIARVFTSGHRNPQGLTYDPISERVFMAEHGPDGGGELNILKPGLDYGWPDVTYGSPYGSEKLPDSDWAPGRWASAHDNFEKPLLSWLPSIAPSQIGIYRGSEFTIWSEDVLVSSLTDRSIHRIRLEGNRVVFDERIEVRERIRDLVILADGRILLSFDSTDIGLLSMGR